MAELATLARPYAEALFEVVQNDDLGRAAEEIGALAAVAADPRMRQFADAPTSTPQQVYDIVASVANVQLSNASSNLLRTVIENGRLAVLPEIVSQFKALAAERSGVSAATVYSAFPIDDGALRDLLPALERRFKRRLEPVVEIDEGLIGGIRVVVGDEVLDTSVRARLAQMTSALTA